MVPVLSNRVLLLFLALFHPASSTRFLPSVIWDNVNTLLCCPYNWLVVPNIDLHDIIEFVCPTSKLVVKQVNDHTRSGNSMNFNLVKREWKGSVQDLQQSISNGSIHPFCNTSHTDSVKLYTCHDGKDDSFPVTFTHFIFPQSNSETYLRDKIYVFYSNGDGSVSSLKSTQAICGMFFAVHVTKDGVEFDVTYGKQAVTSKCKCDTSIRPTKPQDSTSPTSAPSDGTTSTLPSKLPTVPKSRSAENRVMVVTKLTDIATTKTQPKDSDCFPETERNKNWVSIPIFIAIVIASFITGILGTVLFFQVLRRTPARKDGYNNALYSAKEEVTTPGGTASEHSRV